jgi:hypothetical protein
MVPATILQFDQSKLSEVFPKSTASTKLSELQNCRPGTNTQVRARLQDERLSRVTINRAGARLRSTFTALARAPLSSYRHLARKLSIKAVTSPLAFTVT